MFTVPEETQGEKDLSLSRRDFLKSIAGLMALESGVEAKPRRYTTGKLAGRNLNDLYTEYTGIKGTVPETVNIDFESRLDYLWLRKKRRSGHNPVVVETGNQLVKEYKSKIPTLLDISSYIKEINGSIDVVKQTLDWKTYAEIKNFAPKQTALVQKLVSGFSGKDLAAYALTELMPSKDGQLNRDVLAFLLRTAGKEYIEAIPALYDPKTSFGPYQFTEYALYNAAGVKRGASVVNEALPVAHRIPGSVAKLRSQNHHKAAFLFLIENIANLVDRISPRQLSLLASLPASKHPDLLAYVATAHHGPSVAIQIAKRWLDHKTRFPYEASAGRVYRLYAEKTKANMKALR